MNNHLLTLDRGAGSKTDNKKDTNRQKTERQLVDFLFFSSTICLFLHFL